MLCDAGKAYEVRKLLLQVVQSFIDRRILVMEDHSNDIIGGMGTVFAEVAGFIDENAQFFHMSIRLKKVAGNFPAHDGPGSCDQPSQQ